MNIILAVQGLSGLDGLPFREKLDLVERKCAGLVDGFEFLVTPDFVERDYKENKERFRDFFSGYKCNAFHLFGKAGLELGDNDWTRRCFDVMAPFFSAGLMQRAVVHPDHVCDMDFLERLSAEKGVLIGIETLGSSSFRDNRYRDIERILAEHSPFQLVADTAHIGEMVPLGEPPFDDYVTRFSDRLAQVHFSAPGNLYKGLDLDDEINTPHSLVSIAWKRPADFLPGINRVKGLPFTIEGVIPSGDKGEDMLRSEIEFLRNGI